MGNLTGKGGFTPGQSGNPGGRPKRDASLSGILRRYLRAKEEDGRPRNVVLAERLWELTDCPDPDTRLAAIKYIYDRTDGKPVESQQLSGPGGGPIPIREMVVVLPNEPDDESQDALGGEGG